jgi:hypothetical protein
VEKLVIDGVLFPLPDILDDMVQGTAELSE